MSPSSYPPSRLLLRGDPCNDISDGGPGLIDECDKISWISSASSIEYSSSLWLTVEQLSYCGFNDLCGDMMEHENGVITGSTTCDGVSV